MPPVAISRAEARRIALAAQGFGRPRPARPTRRHVRAVFDTVGAVQIDAVNVLVRSHYLPFFSRLGPYDRAALDALTGPNGDIVEYWCHAACLVPAATWATLAWRMRDERSWPTVRDAVAKKPELLTTLLTEVGARGEVSAGELERRDRPKEPWFDWSRTKLLLEYLFLKGEVTAGRRPNFERMYSLPDTRLPRDVVDARASIGTDESKRASLLLAARALGVGTARDIGEYIGMRQTHATPCLRALVGEGVLADARVEGVEAPMYLHRDAARPRRIDAAALVSPFDSLVWQRDRAEELFGFRYRIEIYVPKPKRVHGYYVLPFLLGERFVARVDLKADRSSGHLLVQASYLEPGDDADEVAPALMAELRDMARWLGLDDVIVRPAGDLAPHLART